jgi:hypothetical protein
MREDVHTLWYKVDRSHKGEEEGGLESRKEKI